MKKNVGSMDRKVRGLGALVAMLVAGLAPLPVALRVGVGATAVYLLFTTLAGTCLGYRLMGVSTCPVSRP
jgi:hypothetical protein